jgi:uncharacterized low-complexity protein|uniref:Uncharacterized protein n=1 Tax=Zea mays TaxID=4577 RepID=A0A804P8P1_MAIZE
MNARARAHHQRVRLSWATYAAIHGKWDASLVTEDVAGAETLAVGPAGGVEAPPAAVADRVHRRLGELAAEERAQEDQRQRGGAAATASATSTAPYLSHGGALAVRL